MKYSFYYYNNLRTTIIEILILAVSFIVTMILVDLFSNIGLLFLLIPVLGIVSYIPFLLRKKIEMDQQGLTINNGPEIAWEMVTDFSITNRLDAEPGASITRLSTKKQLTLFFEENGKTSKIIIDSTVNNYDLILELVMEKASQKPKDKFDRLLE